MTMPLSRGRCVFVAVALALGACGDDGTKPQPLTLSLSSSSVTLEELETVQLTADVGGPGSATVSWSSSNDDVATVDGQGRITGVAAGSATVTAAASTDGQSAEGSANVTVTPLPLAIAVEGFVDESGAVSSDALGLGVSAEVVYDVPANFDGFIEVRAGDEVLGRVDVPEPSPVGGAAGSAEVVVTARKQVRSSVSLSVMRLSGESIEPLVTNNVATLLTTRLASSTGSANQSTSSSVSFQVPRGLGIGSIRGERTATDGLGRTWVGGGNPLIVIDGNIVDADLSRIDPSGIVSISVLKDGAATALYGTAAANGVVLIELRDELDGQEGEFTFAPEAMVAALPEPVSVLNSLDLGTSDLGLATGFLFDALPPLGPDRQFPDQFWFQPGPLWPQLSERLDLRFEDDAFGSASFVDGGVGGVQVDLRAGTTTDLELGSIQDLDDAYLALAAGWLLGVDVRDDLDNFRRWILSNSLGDPMRIGVDPTPPLAPIFETGPSFTPPGAVNPASLLFGWSASDADPGSGVDSDAYRISFEWSSPTAGDCLIGFGTGCDPVPAPAGAHSGWTPDNVPTGFSAEFRLGVRATDFATNLGEIAYADWVLDAIPPQASGTPVLGTPANGDVPISGVQIVDDLEVAGTAAVAQYSMGAQVPINPIFLASEQVGTLFDGTFHTAAPDMMYMPLLRSLETTESSFPNRPTGTIYPLAAVTVLGGDHAGHSASVSTTAPGLTPRATSFLAAGMDHFAFRTPPGSICNPVPSNGANCNGTPTTVDIVVEAFTSGQFEIQDVTLVGTQQDPGNPFRLADWTDLIVTDQGGFREGTATFTLDAGALNLSGGFLDIWAIGRDPNGGGILARKLHYTTVF